MLSRETTNTNFIIFSLNHPRSRILEGASKAPMIMTVNAIINDRKSLFAWYTNKKNTKCYLPVRDIKKIYIMNIVFKIRLIINMLDHIYVNGVLIIC